ncbi:MAG: RNA-binding cell elongation regulator Jag/EloR [Ktedonobacterales bacterium]
MESVEASGKSIEDAILQALVRLGRNRDEVDITVLQEPSRGQRGIGSREARVRVYLKQGRPPLPEESYQNSEPYDEEDGESELYYSSPAVESYQDEVYGGSEPFAAASLPVDALQELLPEDASIEEFAEEALRAILGHMGIRASIEVSEPINEEEAEEEPLTLNIHSEDPETISLLIGRRGETLASIQLLVNLIVSKQTGNRERVIIDAERYRERREQNLRSMAARVADQVRRSGHPIMLEAMPPNERRIIHMVLAETSDIATESTGEGDQRRVVVSLKRPARA